jgi:hypothetical protein
MEKLNEAQARFVKDVLQVSFDASDASILTREQLAANLAANGITDYER